MCEYKYYSGQVPMSDMDPEYEAMKAPLVQKVKDLQKNDPVEKQRWYAFCNANPSYEGPKAGVVIIDPIRHDLATLQRFFAALEAGELDDAVKMDYKPEEKSVEWANRIKQFNSAHWRNKEAWHRYVHEVMVCETHDPAQYPDKYLREFVQEYGLDWTDWDEGQKNQAANAGGADDWEPGNFEEEGKGKGKGKGKDSWGKSGGGGGDWGKGGGGGGGWNSGGWGKSEGKGNNSWGGGGGGGGWSKGGW